jgi:hypothetical protein
MQNITYGYAAFLLLLGLGGYALTGATTSLIPAFLGLPVLGLAFAARRPSWRKTAMHIALAIGALGLFAALSRLLPGLLSGAAFSSATMALGLLALSSLIYLGFGIRSFVMARRRQTAL